MIMMRIKTKCMIWAAALCVILAPKALAQDVTFCSREGAMAAQFVCAVQNHDISIMRAKHFIERKTGSKINYFDDSVLNSSFSSPIFFNRGNMKASAKMGVRVRCYGNRAQVMLFARTVHLSDSFFEKEWDYSPATTYPAIPLFDEKTSVTSRDNLSQVYNQLKVYMTQFCNELTTELQNCSIPQ